MVDRINNSSLTLGLLGNLNNARSTQETALERIASGRQINSAKDNAAGLAIVERFLTQLNGFDQTARNANDGISFTQVAEGGLATISEDLQRIRELSIQAANGSLSDNDRQAIQEEVGQLQSEISRRLDTTTFNGVNVLSSDATIEFQVGNEAGEVIDLPINDVATALDPLTSIDVSTQQGASDALAVIDDALQTVADQQVNFGAVQNRLESAISNIQNNSVNTEAARSRIEDTDFAQTIAQQIQAQIQQQSGIAIQAQANSNAQLTLRLLE